MSLSFRSDPMTFTVSSLVFKQHIVLICVQPAITDVGVSTPLYRSHSRTFQGLYRPNLYFFPSNSQTVWRPVASLGCFQLLVGHITQNWRIFLVDFVCKKLYTQPLYSNIIIHLVNGSPKSAFPELWFWSKTTPEGVTASHQLCLSSAWWVFRALLLTENSWLLGPKTTPWEQWQWPKKCSVTRLKRELQILVIVQASKDELHLSHCHIVLDCRLKI